MTASESFRALQKANPRTRAGFAQSVEATAEAVRTRLVTTVPTVTQPRRRLRRASVAGASLAVVTAVAALAIVASPGGGPGVESATAAVRNAAAVTAASAERSGTAVVRITHDGELWAGTTIRWHGADLSLSRGFPQRHAKAGAELLVVDGMMYGFDPADGGWVELGSPASIDPDSGTTPDEYLAATREDVGGATLHRITEGMTGLTTTRHDDGSTVYSGAVEAGLIARETGFKGGQAIRVLPFGYVAHDAAADPSSRLDTAVTVGADGIVRRIAVTWPGWTYTVSYSNLGATPAPAAPANARPLRRR
jgi:hypothetical protein